MADGSIILPLPYVSKNAAETLRKTAKTRSSSPLYASKKNIEGVELGGYTAMREARFRVAAKSRTRNRGTEVRPELNRVGDDPMFLAPVHCICCPYGHMIHRDDREEALATQIFATQSEKSKASDDLCTALVAGLKGGLFQTRSSAGLTHHNLPPIPHTALKVAPFNCLEDSVHIVNTLLLHPKPSPILLTNPWSFYPNNLH